jgi:hypothetical protein
MRIDVHYHATMQVAGWIHFSHISSSFVVRAFSALLTNFCTISTAQSGTQHRASRERKPNTVQNGER